MDAAAIVEVATRAAVVGGADPIAVLPARTTGGDLLFACAFPGVEGHSWLVVAEDGTALADDAAVRRVAELIAICEAADEASATLTAAAVEEILARAAREAAEPDAARAVRAMREALAPLIGRGEEVRVAEGAYLDDRARIANLVGDRFDLLKEAALAASGRLSGTPGEEGEALAEALWNAVRLLTRDGAPDRFRESVEGAMAAASAFADDVVANYLIDFEEMR